MKKRVVSCILIAALAFLLLQYTSTPVKAEDKQNVIDTLNEVLCGIGYFNLENGLKEDVSQWPDNTLADIMDNKLHYMKYDDCRPIRVENADSDRDCYHLADIQALSQECFGMDFPQDHASVKNDLVYFHNRRTEGSTLYVQNYCVRGDTVIAVGIGIGWYNSGDVFQGYFQATFQVNSASRYGYTLTEIQKVSQGKTYTNLQVEASSELVEDTVIHQAERILDGDITTAWVEGVSGVGKGEWIKIYTSDGSKMELSAVEIWHGYHKSQDLMEKNGIPTQLLIETEDGLYQQAYPWSFSNDAVIKLDRPVEASWVKITILDAQAGTRYDDTCISEIRLIGADSAVCFRQEVDNTPDVSQEPALEQGDQENGKDPLMPAESRPASKDDYEYDQEDRWDEEIIADSDTSDEDESEFDYMKIVILAAALAGVVFAAAVVCIVLVLVLKKKR